MYEYQTRRLPVGFCIVICLAASSCTVIPPHSIASSFLRPAAVQHSMIGKSESAALRFSHLALAGGACIADSRSAYKPSDRVSSC